MEQSCEADQYQGQVQSFEDNSGARTLMIMQKFRPRTKHIKDKFWHFMDHVEKHWD